jgi:hypothetical protein
VNPLEDLAVIFSPQNFPGVPESTVMRLLVQVFAYIPEQVREWTEDVIFLEVFFQWGREITGFCVFLIRPRRSGRIHQGKVKLIGSYRKKANLVCMKCEGV